MISASFLSNPGFFLRSYRIKKKITLREASIEAGLDHTFLNKIELGQRNPSLENLVKIGKAYTIPFNILNEICELYGFNRIDKITYLGGIEYLKIKSKNTNRKEGNFTWTILKTNK